MEGALLEGVQLLYVVQVASFCHGILLEPIDGSLLVGCVVATSTGCKEVTFHPGMKSRQSKIMIMYPYFFFFEVIPSYAN